MYKLLTVVFDEVSIDMYMFAFMHNWCADNEDPYDLLLVWDSHTKINTLKLY